MRPLTNWTNECHFVKNFLKSGQNFRIQNCLVLKRWVVWGQLQPDPLITGPLECDFQNDVVADQTVFRCNVFRPSPTRSLGTITKPETGKSTVTMKTTTWLKRQNIRYLFNSLVEETLVQGLHIYVTSFSVFHTEVDSEYWSQ